mmetsp:Transcript_32424/g.103007  ORF Transcript_32424/g.103007 Transcript_32424/m.103007 type:complete len:407 (+) Transcript_32424:1113-2333(+)
MLEEANGAPLEDAGARQHGDDDHHAPEQRQRAVVHPPDDRRHRRQAVLQGQHEEDAGGPTKGGEGPVDGFREDQEQDDDQQDERKPDLRCAHHAERGKADHRRDHRGAIRLQNEFHFISICHVRLHVEFDLHVCAIVRGTAAASVEPPAGPARCRRWCWAVGRRGRGVRIVQHDDFVEELEGFHRPGQHLVAVLDVRLDPVVPHLQTGRDVALAGHDLHLQQPRAGIVDLQVRMDLGSERLEVLRLVDLPQDLRHAEDQDEAQADEGALDGCADAVLLGHVLDLVHHVPRLRVLARLAARLTLRQRLYVQQLMRRGLDARLGYATAGNVFVCGGDHLDLDVAPSCLLRRRVKILGFVTQMGDIERVDVLLFCDVDEAGWALHGKQHTSTKGVGAKRASVLSNGAWT